MRLPRQREPESLPWKTISIPTSLINDKMTRSPKSFGIERRSVARVCAPNLHGALNAGRLRG
jgi:hypothetical protein